MRNKVPGPLARQRALEQAQAKLYSIAGGSIDSGNVRLSSLTTWQRIEYFKTSEFRRWVKIEQAAGNEIFWLKDVDKTQGAGDVFTFFFKYRADNQLFSTQQLGVVQDFVRAKRQQAGLKRTPHIIRAPEAVVDMFRS